MPTDRPEFLSLADLLTIHKDQIGRYGGSHGIRDQGLLESALAQPLATFGGEYLHNGLYEMAAAYLYHIVQNHPFIDGNKRAGAVCAYVFLRMNHIELTASEEAFESLVLAVASGQADKAQAAAFLEQHSRPA